jgi:hypothetical protein
MLPNINTYKEKYHFAMNFYSLFLLFTFIPDFIHTDSGLFRNLFWAIKILLAVWLISKTKRTFFNLSALEYVYLFVFLVYGARMYVNIFINPLPVLNYGNGVMDFIGFCIILILFFSFRYNEAYHSERSFQFFWITLTVGLIIAYFTAFENVKLDVNNVRYDANSTVNSINYGQMGCALSIVSVFALTKQGKLFTKLIFCLTFLIGMISIAKAGSRSPVAVLAFVTIFFFVARMGTLKSLVILLTISVILVFSYQVILDLLSSMGSSIAIRLQSAVVDNESNGRDEIWQNTMNIIGQSPYFGNYYIIPSGIGAGAYPHNFYLEAFMTTGMLGGVPFLFLVVVSLVRSYRLLQQKHPASWIVMLFLQLVIFGCFSTSLYSSQDFWVLLFFVLSAKPIAKVVEQNEQATPEQEKKQLMVVVP